MTYCMRTGRFHQSTRDHSQANQALLAKEAHRIKRDMWRVRFNRESGRAWWVAIRLPFKLWNT